MARKFALLWNRAEAFDTESQESYAEWSTPLRFLGPLGHFGILVPLACFGVWVTWPARSRLWILYVLAGAYAASVVVFFIYARYRFPLVPFLVMFAAAGLAEGAAFLRQRSRNQIMTAAAVAAGVALATNWPMLSTTTMRAVTEHNLGAALQSEGRLDEAVVHYRRAVDIKPRLRAGLQQHGRRAESPWGCGGRDRGLPARDRDPTGLPGRALQPRKRAPRSRRRGGRDSAVPAGAGCFSQFD